jgi:UDP-2,3-diacylglucosamine pyrophosphatase LpxH
MNLVEGCQRHPKEACVDMTAVDSLADAQAVRRFRTLFLSDLHLGTRGSQAELLLDFLKHHDAEKIYLVGDIVDGWRLKGGWYWPQAHNDVVQKLLRKARKGARVVYVPGNHDEFARDYTGMVFGGIEVTDTDVHETADGKKLLVIHGDQFDIVVRHARWLAFLGDYAYEAALFLNTWNNRVRRLFGVGYWSFSAWAKLKVKNAVNFIGDFEETLAAEAERRGVDGVVCGHIHHATIRDIGGMRYVNTGDFVESCTAIVEHADGRLEIIHWQKTAGEQEAIAIAEGLARGQKALPAPSRAAA